MTREKLNRPFEKKDDTDKSCTNTVVSATRTHAEYKILCTGSTAHTGAMTIDTISHEQVKATIKMNAGNGTVTNESTSKWISADCGKVK